MEKEKKVMFGLTGREFDEASDYAEEFLRSHSRTMSGRQWVAVGYVVIYSAVKMMVMGGRDLPECLDIVSGGLKQTLAAIYANIREFHELYRSHGKEAS